MTTMVTLERIKLYLDLTLQILRTVREGRGDTGGVTGERLQSDNPDSTPLQYSLSVSLRL